MVRGVGGSLSEARRGNLVYDPEIPDTADDWPLISRGDALQVTVIRDVNWLQPTGLMPAIEFPAGATESARELAAAALRDVIGFFRDRYGIEADGLSVTFTDEVHGGSAWGSSMSVGFGRFANSGDLHNINAGRTTIAHEYLHVLQSQLALGATVPTWLLEGVAHYVSLWHWYPYSVGEALPSGGWWTYPTAISEGVIDETAPDLSLLGPFPRCADIWAYELGAMAAWRLETRAGPEALIEFWRLMGSSADHQPPGIARNNAWHAAFDLAFGLPLDQFHRDFANWQDGLDRRRLRISDTWQSLDRVTISGRLLGEDVAGVRVVAYRASRWPSGMQLRDDVTDANGRFSIEVLRG